jgi:hypothetical protein
MKWPVHFGKNMALETICMSKIDRYNSNDKEDKSEGII